MIWDESMSDPYLSTVFAYGSCFKALKSLCSNMKDIPSKLKNVFETSSVFELLFNE